MLELISNKKCLLELKFVQKRGEFKESFFEINPGISRPKRKLFLPNLSHC